MSQRYNKLVRDKIPELIKERGSNPIIEILSDEQYKKELDIKLLEEVNEYLEDDNNEEIADILEVIMAILEYRNVSLEEIQKIRIEKRIERGGFKNKIFLKGVQ